MLPSSYTAATVSDLIADINAANAAGGTNTITLTAPTTSPYLLTAVDNTTDGPTGLPVIAKKDMLTIIGNGDTITSSGAGRVFDVPNGGSLTLQNLTLGGAVFGSGAASEGGAIYNQGVLVLSAVTVQASVAHGSNGVTKNNGDGTAGNAAAGGAIWSNGSLTLQNGCLVQYNKAIGGNGGNGVNVGGVGGDASGGGIYVAGGTANLIGATVNNNIAQAGQGGTFRIKNCFAQCSDQAAGGNAFGGGLYVSSGTMNVSSATLDGNQAIWGLAFAGSPPPRALGGGIFVADGTVNLSSDVVDSNVAGRNDTITGLNGGGGIFIGGGTVTLCNDTVEFNRTDGGCGQDITIFGGTVYIDTFTVNHTGNICGTYILKNC